MKVSNIYKSNDGSGYVEVKGIYSYKNSTAIRYRWIDDQRILSRSQWDFNSKFTYSLVYNSKLYKAINKG